MLHPSPWDAPDAVSFILYLSDSEKCGGSTAVVLRQGAKDPAYAPTALTKTPGVYGHWINDRQLAEENYKDKDKEVYEFRQKLYKREVMAHYKPGDLLIYR